MLLSHTSSESGDTLRPTHETVIHEYLLFFAHARNRRSSERVDLVVSPLIDLRSCTFRKVAN